MPINVFGNSSSSFDNNNKIDLSLSVQKPYLISNSIESDIEEDINLKNQNQIKNLPDPTNIQDACTKNYVDNLFNDPSVLKSNNPHPDIDLNYKNIINVGLIEINRRPENGVQVTSKFYVDYFLRKSIDETTLLRLDPDENLNLDEQDSILLNSILTSLMTYKELNKTKIELPNKNYVDKKFDDPIIIKNTTHVDFNIKNLDNVRDFKVNSFPAIPDYLTAKINVDTATSYSVDEPSLLRLDREEKLNLDEQDSIILNSTLTSLKTIIELPTKNFVDSLHEINRNRRDLSSVFNDQDNEFDNNILTKLDSVTVKRNPNLDNEVANKKYVDDSIGEGTIVRFNQTLENYLKVSVGNDTYNLTKYDKIQIRDTTFIKCPNTGGYLLQNWILKFNDRNINGKIQNFIKSTKTNSPTGYSVAMSLAPIGNSFLYIEMSSNNHGDNVLVSFEQTDIIQISNITSYYNRFSILTNDSLKSMGRFRI